MSTAKPSVEEVGGHSPVEEPRLRRRLPALQREELALAFVLTICVSLFPRWRVFEPAWVQDFLGLRALPWAWYVNILFVAVGLIRTLSPQRSGLCIGRIREHWKKVLLVCGGSILATAIVYRELHRLDRPLNRTLVHRMYSGNP